jgi:hypothetical protein
MAYVREDKQKIEIDYPIEKVWAAIPETIKVLEWKIQEQYDNAHKLKVKSRKGFIAYESVLNVEVTSVDEVTTRVAINAETPVTTITSMADFGRTRDRIELFIEGLAVQMDRMVRVDKVAESESKKKKRA